MYGNLGSSCRSLGKHREAKKHHKKTLAMSREISDTSTEAMSHLHLAYDAFSERDVCLQHEIVSNLRASIDKCEKMRSFLGRNEQFKISFSDQYSSPYQLLDEMFHDNENTKDAICVLEFGRPRVLTDLISGRVCSTTNHSIRRRLILKDGEERK